MSEGPILAIDQGTTNTKVLLLSATGEVVARASRPSSTSHPREAWVEQSASAIWEAVADAIREVASGRDDIAGVAISNQRESVVVWDAATGQPVGPCILWQCRRTSAACADLKARGLEAEIIDRSGLAVDPLFSATKIAWVLDNAPGLRERAERGELKAGTVDSWLLWNLTNGARHATDVSNASRTQLFNIDRLAWDERLAEIFRVPSSLLPEVLHSDGDFGMTAPDGPLPAGIPIRALIGDSHAALFGHGVTGPGEVKVTCGTGSSIMSVTNGRRRSSNGLSSTIAWGRDGRVLHALEGNISVSGQTAAFVTRMLGLQDEQALTDLAASVDDSGGVVLIPAMAGLGAPHWNDQARGMISGMTLASTPAHLARATLEAIALQIVDVLVAMEADMGAAFTQVHVDGGAAGNDILMQLLADLSGRRVVRGQSVELSALGAASMASPRLHPATTAASFEPGMEPERRSAIHAAWRSALERATYDG